MTLEEKIVQMHQMGTLPYNDMCALVEQAAQNRVKGNIPDTIYIAEHTPVANFGQRKEHNQFSQELYVLLKELERPQTEEAAIQYLNEQGIDFTRSSRGGGSTYIGPGQLNIYPVIDYSHIADNLFTFKDVIDQLMFEALKNFGLPVHVHEDTRQRDVDRKDVWIEKNGRHYKLGGKGIKGRGTIAYHGFNFYVTREAVKGFKHIKPCGYDNEEVGVMSISEAAERDTTVPEFVEHLLPYIKKHFNYDRIENASVAQR